MDKQETGTGLIEPLVLRPEQRVDPLILTQRAADWTEDPKLRALISQIIREELQGSLGERMTRNMRKLVRREIARSLAERDED
ncbi:hypothetical protein [Poseidonocella sedimentorum]|uniref:Uncharacterized protein n=1 Tax=Poseidonocella sedimentorum TaxID=871652 RepID=A0A1I6DD35_9RHOB|nr:hypothetical protein [Poseidonocella sedimentorum]SFR03359.1 hypothetical protein SAMN04515673_1035 [Poseidonocella sedimentorum]